MSAARLDPALLKLRKRLERWELDHLRQHAAELAERCDQLEQQLQRADDHAESWREEAMRLIDDALRDGDTPGLTVDSHLVIVKGAEADRQAPPLIDTTEMQNEYRQHIAELGSSWQGGLFAGITTSSAGRLYALVLLPNKPDQSLSWPKAMKWAKSIGADLPNRVESALLFANLPDAFEKEWHWTNEQYAGNVGYAWLQLFVDGGQDFNGKSYGGRVRAVRRLPIDPSILCAPVAA